MDCSLLRIGLNIPSRFIRSTTLRCAFYHTNQNIPRDVYEDDDEDSLVSRRPSYTSEQPHWKQNERYSKNRNPNQFNNDRYTRGNSFAYRDRSQFAGGNLQKVDWTKVTLEPVKKDFYQPSEVVDSRSAEEVEEFRKTHNMTVTGSNIPNPLMKFSDYNFPVEVQKIFQKNNFDAPTSIQSQGWPIALSGRDIIGIGETGSGKTLGYTFPALVHINNQTRPDFNQGPIGLVMAPTRELVQQIYEVAMETFGYRTSHSVACLFGGASKNYQARQLQKMPSLCIATPGRLLDFLEMGVTNLHKCSYLVLDEADRMLDMGFEPQIRKIVDQIRPDRQTLMWSATWPREVESLARDYLNDVVQLNVGSAELVANPNIQQTIIVCDLFDKRKMFLKAMFEEREKDSKVLVFAQTKSQVDFLARLLHRERFRSRGIHGDHSQSSRDNTLEAFRSGKVNVLVATDVASRGLDVSDINLVLNYDFPREIESYIHRIGRTGRAGKTGRAVSLFTEDDAAMAQEVVRVLQEAGQDTSPELLDMVEKHRYAKMAKRSQSGGFARKRYYKNYGRGY